LPQDYYFVGGVMNLEIKLSDPKYCNGCPCQYWYEYAHTNKCSLYGVLISKDSDDGILENVIRPEICIKTNGE